MSNSKMLEAKIEKRHRVLVAMYELFDMDKENIAYSPAMLGELAGGIPGDTVGDYMREFEKLGIVSRRYSWGGKDTGLPVGKAAHVTILLPLKQAEELVLAHDAELRKAWDDNQEYIHELARQQKRKPKQKRVKEQPRLRVVEPVIETGVGPGAIVDLARKYRDSTGVITAKLNELEAIANEIGSPLDMDLMREALGVNAALDPRLEAICEVLPYIEALERKVEAMTEMLDAATTKVAQG